MDQEGFWLSFLVRERREAMELVIDKDHEIEVKPKRKRRSLDANAYFWLLLNKLAETLGVPKTDLYRNLIKDIGGNCETVCVLEKAADRLQAGWEHNGLGWVTERFPSKMPGCVNVHLYYGSSTYDTAQMSRLIDLVIAECKSQGIQTMTPDEIALMKARWESAEYSAKQEGMLFHGCD